MERQTCETLIDYFNGQLNDIEKAQFEEHLQHCPSCQEELAEWQLLADDLPYAVDTVLPPNGMKDRILSNIVDDKEEEMVVVNNKPIPKKPSVKWMPFIAAALLLSIGANIFLASIVSKQTDELATSQETVDELLAYVQLSSTTGDVTGTASMVKHGEEVQMVVTANSLPQLSNEEVFQVWLIDEDGPKRAGSFQTTSENGTMVFTLPENMNKDWSQIAVSHEPNKDSEKPLGEVLLASDL
ncbi:anti-sigma factor [Paenisporosarcina cavernae]|uniref:Anti-sigma-W factor RsiW n=1 Tax=Paenisporosarcina cavernae TaxID=2320858 RepID=A0A385YVB6_9BACL|nr:anti-sigma factor [Paenisporosarcina cavernae]AYC30421.1 hypothetical protein D3873_11475 [Paenisporosarcina cavernae]